MSVARGPLRPRWVGRVEEDEFGEEEDEEEEEEEEYWPAAARASKHSKGLGLSAWREMLEGVTMRNLLVVVVEDGEEDEVVVAAAAVREEETGLDVDGALRFCTRLELLTLRIGMGAVAGAFDDVWVGAGGLAGSGMLSRLTCAGDTGLAHGGGLMEAERAEGEYCCDGEGETKLGSSRTKMGEFSVRTEALALLSPTMSLVPLRLKGSHGGTSTPD